MAETDRRIVQMQFDNRQFEKNIARSTKSIEELKEAMDFEETSNGLEKFSHVLEKLNFNGIENNLQKLADKFTGLGNAAEYILSRIRYSIESAALSMEHFIKSLTISQIPVGQNKFDQLTKAVTTIVSAGKYTEDEAYAVMERVMEYTRQTSHDFSTMVGQISGLTSVGKGLVESERLIEAIGNAATYAGKGAQEAAASMSILSKAFSSSFLSSEQFQSLNQTYHVITDKWREQALAAAEAAGTLKRKGDKLFVNVKGQKAVEVTAKNLETTLRSRWLTTEVLEKIYESYKFGESMDELRHPEKAVDSFGKTAYLTGQRALSLADAFNAIRESVSSGWMESFQYIFGKASEAAERFTELCDRIIGFLEGIQEFRNNLLKNWASAGGRDSLFNMLLGSSEDDLENQAYGFMNVLEDIGKMVSDAFWDFVKLFVPENLRGLWDNSIFVENGGREAFLGVNLKRFTDGIQEKLQGIRDFFNEEIDVGGQSKTRLAVIHDILTGIGAALKFAWDILAGIFVFGALIAQQLGPSFDAIIGFFSKLGEEIYASEQEAGDTGKIKKFFTDLAETIRPITDGINICVTALTNFLSLIFGLNDETKGSTKGLSVFGQLLLTIANIVAKVAGPILTFLGSVLNLVTDLMSGKIDLKTFGKQLGDAVAEMMKSFADSLPDSLKMFKDWIYDLFGLWEDESEDRSKSFFTFLRTVFTGGFSNIGELLGQLTSGFSLSKALETGFGFGSAFNFLNTLIGAFKGTNLYTLVLAFLGVSTVFSFNRLIGKAKEAVKTITEFFDNVGGNLKEGFLGEYEWFGERMLNLAKTIGILAAVVVAFGSMDTGKMIQGILGLTAVLGLIIGFYYLLTGTKEKNPIVGKATYAQQVLIETLILTITAMVVTISLSIGALALALTPLASDWKKMAVAIVGFTAMLAAMGAFIVLMIKALDGFAKIKWKKDSWGKIGKIAVLLLTLSATIAILSAAIGALAVALTPLAMTGWGGMLRAIIAFGAILAMVGVFINVMVKRMDDLAFQLGGSQKGEWAGLGKMAAMLIVLAASTALLAVGIGALVVAVTPLAAMSWGGFVRAMAGLGIVMLELSAMIKFITNLTTTDKAATIKIAGLAGFAFSLGVLIFALTPLAMMNWGGWARSMAGLAIVLAEMIAAIYVIKRLKIEKTQLNAFAGFAFSLGILIFSLQPLAAMDWGGWARSMAGLAIVLLEMLGFAYILRRMHLQSVNLKGFVGFALSLAILMFAMKPLAEMTPEGYLRAIAGLTTVLLEMIIVMALMKELKPNLKEAGSTAILLIALGASMVLFGMAMKEVQDVPWQNIVAFAGGLAVLLAVMALGGVVANVVGIKGMLILAAGLAAILGVISLMAPILIGSISGALRNAAGDIAIVADLIKDISGKMDGSSESGFDRLEKLIGKMGGIIGLMAKFTFAADATRVFMESMAEVILAIDQILKVSARAKTLSSDGETGHLKTVVAGYKDIFENYLNGWEGFTERSDAFKSRMAEMVLAIIQATTADQRIKAMSDDGGSGKLGTIIQGYKGVFETDLAGWDVYAGRSQFFYDALFKLGSAFDYFDSMSGDIVSPEDNQGLQLIKQLAACAPDLDTIYKMDLDTFKTQLAELGGAMIIYAQGAKEVAGEKIGEDTDVSSAVTLLHKIADAFREDGGFEIPENMPEGQAVTDFGVSLAALAGALVAFEQAGQGLGTGTANALATLDFFMELKAKLAEMNQESDFGTQLTGAINAFKDENGNFIQKDELTTFGEDIAQLGSAMKSFAEATQVVDEETHEVKPIDFSKATDALTAIAELQNQLPRVGGLLEVIRGRKQKLSELSSEIILLGGAIGDFYDKTTIVVNGVPEQMDFTKATDFLNSIADIQSKLPVIKKFKLAGIFENKKMTLEDLAAQLVLLGSGLKEFHEDTTTEINGKRTEYDFTNAIAFLNSVSDIQSKLPTVKSFSLQSLFEDKQMTLGQLGSELVQLGSGLRTLSNKLTGETNGNKNFDTTTLTEATTFLTGSIIPLMQSMAMNLPKTGSLWDQIGNALTGKHDFTFTELSGQLTSLGDGLGALGKGLNEGKWADNTGANNAFETLNSVIELMTRIRTFYDNLGEGVSAYGAFSSLTEFISYFVGNVEDFNNPERKVFPVVEQIAQFMKDIDIALTGWSDSNNEDLELALKRMELFSLFTQGLNALTTSNIQSSWSYIGNKLTTDIATAITDGITNVTESMKTLLVSTYTAVSVLPEADWNQLGQNIALGVKAGVDYAGPLYVTPAVKQMMIDAYNAGKQAIDSNSPSKEFMKLGEFMGEGTAIGIEKSTDEVGENAGTLGEVAIEKARDMIALISAVMAEEMNTNPTITPILDMSQLEAGLADMNGRFSTYGFGLNASGAAASAGRIGTSAYADESRSTAGPTDLTGIYDRMNTMNDQIDKLGASIRQMKLVLDTGIVAGAITDQIDANLGRSKFYAERRN